MFLNDDDDDLFSPLLERALKKQLKWSKGQATLVTSDNIFQGQRQIRPLTKAHA